MTDLRHDDAGGETLAQYAWTYDDAYRVSTFASSQDGSVTYGYDGLGQVTSADYDYQTDESYGYDDAGNRLNYTVGDHNRILSDGTYTYAYDEEGNRTKRTEIATGA